jgi:hypothetical protein
MGSMPRKEENERKARERAAMQPALDCEACGALTPGERFRYYADQIVCEACNERNPQSRRRLVPRALLQPRSVCVNFLECRGLALQAMALDHRTMLGPPLRIQSADTLRRLLKDDPMKWDGKVYRPAGEGFRWDTADGAQRKAQNARRRKKYAQMRAEEVRDGFVRNPKWQEPTLLARIWEEIRYILFPPRRRY